MWNVASLRCRYGMVGPLLGVRALSDFARRPRRHLPSNDQVPTKDRSPPMAYDPLNPKRKLAVLVDAQKVDADVFCRNIEPALHQVGVPILIRLFDHELSPRWASITAGGLADAKDGTSEAVQRPSVGPSIEWFRVERFIPVSMQIMADANHIYDYRSYNCVDAACYVCTELERPHYEALFSRLKGNGFNQYLFDELGLAVELNEDKRSRDGA